MKKLLMAAALSTLFIAGSASAQVSQGSQMYIGAGAGASKTDTKETSWKVYGGVQFNPIWGLELGYTDLGKFRGSDINSWSLAGTAKLPLAEKWALLGKLGAAWNRPSVAGANKHTDVLLGIGLGYSMNKNLGLRLEYEDFGKLTDVNAGNDSKGRNLALSVTYAF